MNPWCSAKTQSTRSDVTTTKCTFPICGGFSGKIRACVCVSVYLIKLLHAIHPTVLVLKQTNYYTRQTKLLFRKRSNNCVFRHVLCFTKHNLSFTDVVTSLRWHFVGYLASQELDNHGWRNDEDECAWLQSHVQQYRLDMPCRTLPPPLHVLVLCFTAFNCQ
jgi:hypothetical protein